MSTLVVAEYDAQGLKSSTASAVTAAQRFGVDVTVLVIGADATVADAAAQLQGVARVLHVTADALTHPIADQWAPLVVQQVNQAGFSQVIAGASTLGKDLIPRVAALLDVECVSDVIEIQDAQTYRRPIYAGNAIATVQNQSEIQVLTVRTTAFAPAQSVGSAPVESVAAQAPSSKARCLSTELTQSDRPELTAAQVVVSGGRGVGSAENFDQVFALADKLGAAVGASRAAVDAGYVPNDMQVGQTGKVVAPDLYIAVGISGAIQHLAGMKDSKVVVAINQDPEAPIFESADYGLVGDLFDVLPELTAKV